MTEQENAKALARIRAEREKMLECYDSIEEAIGIPLDKFARIFREGIYYKGDCIYPNDIMRVFIATYKNDRSFLRVSTYEYKYFGETLYLDEFGKSWWLMSEKKNNHTPLTNEQKQFISKTKVGLI